MTRKCLTRIFRIIILAALAVPAVLWTAKPALMPETAAAQTLTASQNALARDIENNLIAPCCWVQPISEHPSEVSDMMRAEVREMIAEGKSRSEILDYYVARYGERILAAPPARGINVLAYAAPFAALILGGGGLFMLRGKRRVCTATPPAAAASRPPQNDNRYNDIIEKELRELDD
ncbi:MAG: cytochrome c-type biogenesis protein CcmH [Acidobacteria bacterium]|nr:cytochrome c-type biogenesis protein CcmH [Acidobacteriota bacterium]